MYTYLSRLTCIRKRHQCWRWMLGFSIFALPIHPIESCAASIPGDSIQSLTELAESASIIVRGEVISVHSRWHGNKINGARTSSTIAFGVAEFVKGHLEDSTMTFESWGGLIDTMAEYPSATYVFNEGESLILFLRGKPGSFALYPFTQGILRIEDGQVNRLGIKVHVADFTRYLKTLTSGQGMSLESFLGTTTPDSSVKDLGGGTLPPEERIDHVRPELADSVGRP